MTFKRFRFHWAGVVSLLLSIVFIQGQSSIPTPESVLGQQPGADFYLASYDESLAYFQKLAPASDRIQLQRVGETSNGVEWYLAVISSPQNLMRHW